MKRYCALFLVFALTIGPLAGSAQKSTAEKPAFEMTIDSIMRGPGLFGYPPAAVRWSPDSKFVYFQWKKYDEPREKNMDTYRISADGSGLKKLSEEEAKDTPPVAGEWTKDKKRAVYGETGDLFLYDSAKPKRLQLTKTTDVESNPRFTRDEKRITFMRGGNLYMMSLEDASLTQLTEVQAPGVPAGAASAAAGGRGGQGRGGLSGATGSTADQKGTDSQEYLKKEEKDLIDYIKRRAAKREEDEAKRKKENPRKPFALQTGQSVTAMTLSPDQKLVVAMVSEAGTGAKNDIVPNFVTESAYVEDIPGRNNVGDNQNRIRIALVDVDTGEVKWVDHGQKPLPEEGSGAASTAPPAGPQGRGGRPAAPAERNVQLSPPLWSEDGTRAFLQGRSSDNKDRWLFALDPATGKTRVLFTEHDDAWINGGGGGFGGPPPYGWMRDDKSIYFLSEKSGYAHLYTVSFDGGEAKQLTSGKFEVSAVSLSEDKTRFFFTSSEPDASDRRFYTMPAPSSASALDSHAVGGERTCVTTAPGLHQTFVSPDEKKIAVIYSYVTKPPELLRAGFQAGAVEAQATSSPAKDFADYRMAGRAHRAGAGARRRDGSGAFLQAANYRRGGPAVVFVHGAGYAQNVHQYWSPNYSHEYLFHHFLMEHGYMVLDMDYRASAGYGRDWRAAIYRHMGGKDLDDNVDRREMAGRSKARTPSASAFTAAAMADSSR